MDAHVMCITGNMVLVIFYSVAARNQVMETLILERCFTKVEDWSRSCGMESVNSKDSDAINCYEEHGEARSDEDASLKGQTMFLPLLWVQGRLSACSSCGIKPNEVEGVGLQEGSILRCMNVLWWDAMDGPSNIGEKGDDGRGLPNTFSKVEVVTYNGADCR
ncbi:hypothetical protein V6N11_054444 [Hibiscus sabdariffa]|uniref:Uncharacterized protein n=1 Tax=Hibiscus sabdariffa TaxID=183260 RepID=A0ABR2S4S2_9ROSI